jgi:X-X-X-Leu-X-X-Gly heptad repeat protein
VFPTVEVAVVATDFTALVEVLTTFVTVEGVLGPGVVVAVGLAFGFVFGAAEAGKVTGGVETLTDGVDTLTEGVETLTDGAGFVDAAETLTDGVETLTDGVETLTDGVETLTDGVETLTDGVETLTAGAGDEPELLDVGIFTRTETVGAALFGVASLPVVATFVGATVTVGKLIVTETPPGTLTSGGAEAEEALEVLASKAESAADMLAAMVFEIAVDDVTCRDGLAVGAVGDATPVAVVRGGGAGAAGLVAVVGVCGPPLPVAGTLVGGVGSCSTGGAVRRIGPRWVLLATGGRLEVRGCGAIPAFEVTVSDAEGRLGVGATAALRRAGDLGDESPGAR